MMAIGGGQKDRRTEGRTDGRRDGRLEIPPCVLQDIGPLGLLPKKRKMREERRKKRRSFS